MCHIANERRLRLMSVHVVSLAQGEGARPDCFSVGMQWNNQTFSLDGDFPPQSMTM